MFYAIDRASDLPMLPEILKPTALKDRIIRKLGKPIITSGDIYPGDVVPVSAMSHSGRETVFPMVWGIHDKGIVHYLVSEQAASRVFPESWQYRWCVVLASYYYQEPDNPEDSNLYAVQPRGSFVYYMAGLHILPEDGFPRFVILTRKATEDTSDLASKMPVVLKDTTKWIEQSSLPERILRQKPPRMIYERIEPREHDFIAQCAAKQRRTFICDYMINYASCALRTEEVELSSNPPPYTHHPDRPG